MAALRATRLSDDQVGIAEAAFKRLERNADLITAVDHWLRTGQPKTIKESPRLDEALKTYTEWLATTTELRDLTKNRLRNRVEHFVTNTGNVRVTDVLPEHIENIWRSRRSCQTPRMAIAAHYPASLEPISKPTVGWGRQMSRRRKNDEKSIFHLQPPVWRRVQTRSARRSGLRCGFQGRFLPAAGRASFNTIAQTARWPSGPPIQTSNGTSLWPRPARAPSVRHSVL